MNKSITKFVSVVLLFYGLIFNLTLTNSRENRDWIGLHLTETTAIAQSEVNHNDPNPCLAYIGVCYWKNGTYALKSPTWD